MVFQALRRYFRRDKRGYDFSEEERERSHISRRETAIERTKNRIRKQQLDALHKRLLDLEQKQKEKLMQQQIEELEDDLYEGDEDEDEDYDGRTDSTPEALLTQYVLSRMPNLLDGNKSQQGTPEGTIEATQKRSLTDDELRTLASQIPKAFLKKAKKMSDEEILTFARMYQPDLIDSFDDDTKARALLLIREQ